MLPNDFPQRFFNPLTSKHREMYIHVLLAIESALEQSKRIALPRNALLAELRRVFQRENYALEDVSDEEDYEETIAGDAEQNHLAYTIRLFLRSGWIDADDSVEHATELLFITLYGKKLTLFLNDLGKMEDQSGQVVNTFSNLRQVRTMPDNGYICIQNAYESTQRLLTNLEMMYSKIKMYYTAVLKNTKPEEVLTEHFHGYVRDVVDKLIFPIKVDDSIDRFRGPILDALQDIHSDTSLLEQIIIAAVQTKRTSSTSDGWAEILKMLNFIKTNFDDIESYVQQLDDKNQNYIRTTRQKLTYMLSMDTSVKGDIISILRNAKDRPEDYWERIGECFTIFDVRQISESSFYKPRIHHVRDSSEPLGIDNSYPATKEDMDVVIDMHIARFLGTKVNDFAQKILEGKEFIIADDFALADDDDYLMAMFLAMNSTNNKCVYSYQAENGMTTKGRYGIANFTMHSKEDVH
jgi:hypothetical protein